MAKTAAKFKNVKNQELISRYSVDRVFEFKIKVAAGRVNFSWNNATGRLWTFPAGTVLYADGVTPILTSTAQQPDVTIPVGDGTITLQTSSWAGNYSLNDNTTDARFIGSITDLPPLTYYLSLGNCSLVTGDLTDLPALTHLLSLYNCNLITGALADLPPLTYYLSLYNCNLITGAYTNVSGTNVPTTTILTDTGLSATDMDNTLIAYALTTKNNGTFTATGMTRTTASDAAVSTLTGRGWTIIGITVV